MPSRSRATLPETAEPLVPQGASWEALAEAAARCRACPLWERGTQTVFGAGPRRAPLMLVGEQPGSEEDLAGRPFIGPAGRLLDAALAAAGIDRAAAYVTNAVKHFKWEERGKRRIHQKPTTREVQACAPWLRAEVEVMSPEALVCLGATAAQLVLGKGFRVRERRGELLRGLPWAGIVMATVHPSAILRVRDPGERRAELARLVQDLARVAGALEALRAGARP